MKHLKANLSALQIYQPESWNCLKNLYDSPFEIESGQLSFLGRSWQLSADFAAPSSQVAIFIYGMGDAQALRQLLQQLTAECPVLVLDSQPELVWSLLGEYDYSDLLSDPRLCWIIDKPEKLIARLSEYRLQLQDQIGIAWLENQGLASLGQLLNDSVLQLFRHEAQQQTQNPLKNLQHLSSLYQTIEPEMARAYATYPLSCRSGCADCCKSSVGFHLCINPLEWALTHQSYCALPKPQRQQIFEQAVSTLAPHSDFMIELLHYFDTQPERLSDPAFHLELLHMAGERRESSCVFLNASDSCQVYAGRPFTCRVFGNSHVQFRQAFTCSIDHERMEKIILNEAGMNQLLDSSKYRNQLWDLHALMPYKQVLNLWVLTHLDFENQDFLPLRLDYQQFQSLVRHPETLDTLLHKLQQIEN